MKIKPSYGGFLEGEDGKICFPPQNWQMSKWKNRYFPMSVSPKYLELVRLEEAGGHQITSVNTTVYSGSHGLSGVAALSHSKCIASMGAWENGGAVPQSIHCILMIFPITIWLFNIAMENHHV